MTRTEDKVDKENMKKERDEEKSDNKILKEIRKYALQNAVLHDGKANPKAVLGKILGKNKELRNKAKELLEQCNLIVEEVNKLSVEEQKRELEQEAPELLERKKQKKDLPELPNAEVGKVVTRIPPEPSKYNHIGHALSFLINYLYAKKYKGKCVLRFEDTNPETSKQEYVDAMKQDVLEYLDIKPDKIVFVSDDMPRFYELAEDLIKRGHAYVCSCPREKMQELRKKGIPCECRSKPVEKNLEEWHKMINREFKEGERVLRLKIDMKSKNYVMRDPVIFRINYTPHYRQGTKYCVYPMYDFENAVEEEFCGVTHILRSAEFGKMRIELQNYIKDLFGFKKQIVVQYGRFNIVGAVTQGRIIRQLIQEGKVLGWDDPSLVTLRALRRRGIQKETYYELARIVGLSPTPTNIDWSVIASINRRILDPITKRFFFINEPVRIRIKDAPEQELKIRMHPDNDLGVRSFKVKDEFFITRKDYERLEDGKIYRLMECLNFKKQGDEFIFDSIEYENYKEKQKESGSLIMHWLPADKENERKLIKVKVFTPEHEFITGIGEEALKEVKQGEVVQFERFGFVRFDHSENKEGKEKGKETMVFWFTHK